jgi:P pilus assembly chaperone PapD
MTEAVHTRACTGMKKRSNSVTVQNPTHVYMKFSDHKDLGNHLLQLCPKVVKRHVYYSGEIQSLKG